MQPWSTLTPICMNIAANHILCLIMHTCSQCIRVLIYVTAPVAFVQGVCCSRPAFAPAMMSAVMSERGACFAASTSAPRLQRTHQAARPILCCASQEAGQPIALDSTSDNPLSRRAVMSASLASAAVMLLTDTPAYAVQGYTAGRIPGNRWALA